MFEVINNVKANSKVRGAILCVEEGNMQVGVYVKELTEIMLELPEDKVLKLIAYARQLKEKSEEPARPLSTKEILSLARKRAEELRRQPRQVVEAQYQALLAALEAEVQAKGIEVDDFPNGD